MHLDAQAGAGLLAVGRATAVEPPQARRADRPVVVAATVRVREQGIAVAAEEVGRPRLPQPCLCAPDRPPWRANSSSDIATLLGTLEVIANSSHSGRS